MRKLAPTFLLVLLLGAALSFLFAPFLHNYFVADDFWHLSFPRFALQPEEVWWKPCYGRVFWRPLAWSLDVGLYYLFGPEPFGHHLTDAVLHGLNALLVAGLAWTLSRSLAPQPFWRYTGAYLSAFLFALHPIGTLTASWLCCRSVLLGTFCGLLSLLVFFRFRDRRWAPLLSGLLALGAMLSKETMVVLPALLFAAAWLFPSLERKGWHRAVQAGRETLPLVVALLVYFSARWRVLGELGGYEPLRFQSEIILAQLAYHLPRLAERAFRDFLFHHLGPGSPQFRVLVGAFLLLLALTGWRMLKQERRWLFFSLAWMALALAPLWNMSQMLVQREERLLYFGLAGFLLLAPAGMFALRRPVGRVMALALWVSVLYSYTQADLPALKQWQEIGRANQALAVAVRQKVTEFKPAPAGGRFYLVGLSEDQYYLDAMVKLGLPTEYLNNRFMLAEHPSLVWEFLPALSAAESSSPAVEPTALPREKIHETGSHNRLVVVTPPALVSAIHQDPMARVWEWKGDLILDLTPEIRALKFQMVSMQNNYSAHRLLLPTWSFYQEPLPLTWTLSADCRVEQSDRAESLLGFVAQGDDCYLVSPEFSFHAAGAAGLVIELKVAPEKYLPAEQAEAVVMWSTEREPRFRPGDQIRFLLRADGEFHRYQLDLESNLAWLRSGRVRRIRLDPVSYPTRFWLRRVLFLSKEEVRQMAEQETAPRQEARGKE